MSVTLNKSLKMEGRERNEHLLALKGFVAFVVIVHVT